MAEEYTWEIVDGYPRPISAGQPLYPSTEKAKYQYDVNPYINNGYPYNGYMLVNKSYPPIEPKRTEYLDILDRVRVYSPPHGLDTVLLITEMEIPLNEPEKTVYSMGTDKKVSLTSVNNSINESLKKQLTELPSKSSILEEAQENAAALINNSTGGYITLRKNEDGYVEELIISDEANYENAKNVWVWNRGGLGFSSNGYRGEKFDLALTADGKIVADMITTGVLSADRIRSGKLKIGGLDYAYDENGNVIATINRDDMRVEVIQMGADENGPKELRCMSLGGGQIRWDDLTYDENSQHVGHIDSYNPPQTENNDDFPWMAFVCERGLMINPNSLGIMKNRNDQYYYLTEPERTLQVLNASFSDDEDDKSISVITDIELDEDGKIKEIKRKTLSAVKMDFIHGLLIDEGQK